MNRHVIRDAVGRRKFCYPEAPGDICARVGYAKENCADHQSREATGREKGDYAKNETAIERDSQDKKIHLVKEPATDRIENQPRAIWDHTRQKGAHFRREKSAIDPHAVSRIGQVL